VLVRRTSAPHDDVSSTLHRHGEHDQNALPRSASCTHPWVVIVSATAGLRDTGLDVLDVSSWGTHLCLFYEQQADLVDVVVPYLAAGLNANELCVWMPSNPAAEEEVRSGLKARVPDLDERLASGQLEFSSGEGWYRSGGVFDVDAVMARWEEADERAHTRGFAGLRASGDLGWAKDDDRARLLDYEMRLHEFMHGRRMMILCTYPLEGSRAVEVLDLAQRHHVVMARRRGRWESVETPEHAGAVRKIEQLNRELEQRVEQSTAELRRSERYLAEGQSLTHSGSLALDVATNEFTFWSPEHFLIFGFEPGPTPPSFAAVMAKLHPDSRIKVQRAIKFVSTEARDARITIKLLRGDGSTRYMQCTLRPVMDGERVTEIIGSSVDVTERKRSAARLARVRRRAQEQALEARVAAILEERSRIAREIHDSLLQGVTGIALQLRALMRQLRPAGANVTEAVRRLVDLAEATTRDARRTVWEMRPIALIDSDLPAALEQVARAVAADISVDVAVEGERYALPSHDEDAILRVAQESIANAVKHSNTASLQLTLRFEEDSVLLSVTDRGRGFDVTAALHSYLGRWGLLGMRERADRIGATLNIESQPGAGTTVTLRVPRRRGDTTAAAAERSAS
jgi:signal transduction histidine kinase